jgi:hypothetical protein
MTDDEMIEMLDKLEPEPPPPLACELVSFLARYIVGECRHLPPGPERTVRLTRLIASMRRTAQAEHHLQ